MNRTARLFLAVCAAGIALTGCATGLTAGDQAQRPAAADSGTGGSGSIISVPGSTAPAAPTAESPQPGNDTEPAAPGGISVPGVSVGPDGITAPGMSVGPDGITAPGMSVGPGGISVSEQEVGSEVMPSEELEEMVAAPYVTRDCAAGENVTIDIDGSTFLLSGDCASITISADKTYVTVDGSGALTISGDSNTVMVGTYSSLEVSGSSNYVTFGEGPAPVDTGAANTLVG